MNILVTGSKGQMGSEIRNLADTYPQTKFFFTDLETDICDAAAVEKVLDSCNINMIINCAAYTAVDKAEQEPEKAYQVNAEAVKIMTGLCKKKNIYLIHISTDYVFDGTHHRPYKENDPTTPDSVYGKSKLEGEKHVVAGGIPSMIVRTSWLYSAYGHNFVKTILRLTGEKPELRVVADQVGTPTHAADLAKHLLYIVHHCKLPGKPVVYHYSNQGAASWYDFAYAITELSGLHIPVIPIPSSEFNTPAKRPFYSLLDKSLIIADFGINIPHWQKSLGDCLKIIAKSKD